MISVFITVDDFLWSTETSSHRVLLLLLEYLLFKYHIPAVSISRSLYFETFSNSFAEMFYQTRWPCLWDSTFVFFFIVFLGPYCYYNTWYIKLYIAFSVNREVLKHFNIFTSSASIGYGSFSHRFLTLCSYKMF